MKISVVILDYLKAERVVRNVASLLSQVGNFEMEIIVVDNSCNSENAEKLLMLAKSDKVKVLINKKNSGYTRGNNIGAKDVKGDYVFIVNPDIICKDNFVIEKLVKYLENHKEVGILGPKQINDDSTIPTIIRKFPNILVQIFRRTLLGKLPILSTLVAEDEMRYSDLDLIKEVDWIQSSFMAIRRNVWDQLHGFDETYFIFMSDCEICFQCWKIGKKVIYYPEACVYADGKRCSQGGFIKFFKSGVLRQHFYDSIKYTFKHFLDANPKKSYYLSKNNISLV